MICLQATAIIGKCGELDGYQIRPDAYTSSYLLLLTLAVYLTLSWLLLSCCIPSHNPPP